LDTVDLFLSVEDDSYSGRAFFMSLS